MRIHVLYLLSILFILPINLYPQEVELQFDINKDGEALTSALLKSVEKAYGLNMKGLDALELDNYDEALELFNQAIELVPIYSDAINNKGVIYFRRGNVVLAKEIWENVIKIDPEYSTAYYNLGIINFNEKKYETAKQYFLQTLDKNKRFVDALAMLGKTDLILGNLKNARGNLKKAYSINPAHQGVWGSLAYCMVTMGDTADAEKILKKQNRNAYALKMLGQIEAARGHAASAIKLLTEAITRGGEKSIFVDIAQIQFDSGQCKEALSTLESYMARVSPPSADACLLAGIAAKDCGNIAATEKFFEQGIRYYPNDQLLRFNLGQVYFYQKDYHNADKVWSVLSDTLNDPALYYLRAVAAKKLIKFSEAEKHIYKAISMDTKAEYYDLLGIILYEKGKKDDAVIQFNKALALNPSLRSAQLNLAISGKTQKGINKEITAMIKQHDTCSSDCNETLLQLSILYYHGMQYENAIKTLLNIPQKEQTLPICRHLSIYYRAIADYNNALSVLEKAQKRFAFNVQIEHELAETYLQAGLYGKAIMVLKRLVNKWDKNPWRLHYQLGYAYVKQNDLENAETYLKKSLEGKKDNVASHSLLAFIYNERGETKKAYNLWEKTLRDDPSNPALWINMALLLEKEGKYLEAVETYQKALSLPKGNKSIYINIGNAYKNMKEPDKAMNAYEKALDSDKRIVAAYNLFIVAKSLDEKGEAEKILKLLNKEFPESIYTKRSKGEMLLWQGDTTKALPIFESLPQKNQFDWFALANIYVTLGKNSLAEDAINNLPKTEEWNRAEKTLRARIAFKDGRYTEALALWKEQNDTSFDGQYNIALTAFNAGEYDAAIQIGKVLMQRSAGSDKENICRLIGNSAIKLKDWEGSKSWFSRLVEVKPNDAVAYYNMAVANFKLNDMDNAWELYQKAREIDPSMRNSDIEKHYKLLQQKTEEIAVVDSIDELYNSAVLLQQNGNDTAAEEMYKKIILQDKRHYRAWNNLGAIHGARGEHEKAIECYKNAVSRRADIADGYANLVNIYIALEDFKKAKKWLDKGFKKNPDSDVLRLMEKELHKVKSNNK